MAIPRLMFLQDGMKLADIVHGMAEDVDLGELLVGGGRGDVLAEDLKSAVDCLHSLPLSGISLGGLEIFCWLDGVAMDGMKSHQLRTGTHGSLGLCPFGKAKL